MRKKTAYGINAVASIFSGVEVDFLNKKKNVWILPVLTCLQSWDSLQYREMEEDSESNDAIGARKDFIQFLPSVHC